MRTILSKELIDQIVNKRIAEEICKRNSGLSTCHIVDENDSTKIIEVEPVINNTASSMLSYASTHEILGLLLNEFDDIKNAVKNNDLIHLEKELFDLVIVSIYGIASMMQDTLDY